VTCARIICNFITARRYASEVYAMDMSVCLSISVRLTASNRCSIKKAESIITQTTPHGSPAKLVFWCQRS